MKIKDGGSFNLLRGKLESIRISKFPEKRIFELWINDDSLSYITLDELLELRDEINNELKKIIQE